MEDYTLGTDMRINPDYSPIPNYIILDETLSVDARMMYSILQAHIFTSLDNREEKVAFPSINRLCKIMCKSKPTIIKAIKELEERKIIIKYSSKSDNVNNVNKYKVCWYEPFEGSKIDLPPSKIDLLRGSKADLLGVVKQIDTNKNNINNNIFNKNTFLERNAVDIIEERYDVKLNDSQKQTVINSKKFFKDNIEMIGNIDYKYYDIVPNVSEKTSGITAIINVMKRSKDKLCYKECLENVSKDFENFIPF